MESRLGSTKKTAGIRGEKVRLPRIRSQGSGKGEKQGRPELHLLKGATIIGKSTSGEHLVRKKNKGVGAQGMEGSLL